jgi:hypothetical protein
MVAEDVHVPEDPLCLLGSRLQRGPIGNIHSEGVESGASAKDAYGIHQVIFAHIRHHHPHSGFQERLRHAEADAARTPRDERYFILDVSHDRLWLPVRGGSDGSICARKGLQATYLPSR